MGLSDLPRPPSKGRYQIVLTEEQDRALDRLAAETGNTRSAVLGHLIDAAWKDFVEDHPEVDI